MKRLMNGVNGLNSLNIVKAIKKQFKEINNTTSLTSLAILITLVALALFVVYFPKQHVKERFSFPFLAKPHLSDLDKIYIKTVDGKYITSCPNCLPKDANITNKCTKTLCLKDIPYLSSQFTYHKHRDGTFSLETSDGKYWKRCAECLHLCPHTICSDGINPNLQTHKFVLIKNRNGTVSIKTDNGRLLEVTECEQTCGEIITALGLNISNNFIVEKIQQPPIPLSQRIKGVDFSKKLPREFPEQWPFTQS
jgi:hypothetical protein